MMVKNIPVEEPLRAQKLTPPKNRSAAVSDGSEANVEQVVQDIENYLKFLEDEYLTNIFIFFSDANAVSNILYKSKGYLLIDFLKKLSSYEGKEHSGEFCFKKETRELIIAKIETFQESQVEDKHLVGFVNLDFQDISDYFGADIADKVRELKIGNDKLSKTRHDDDLLVLANNLGRDKNAFHGKGIRKVNITKEDGQVKSESLLNSYQIDTLSSSLGLLTEKGHSQSAAEEYVIKDRNALSLFAQARKLFVYDHTKGQNIIDIYARESLLQSDESEISRLKKLAGSQDWQQARMDANIIWHGNGEDGLDKNQENSEKLVEARSWLEENGGMLLAFTESLHQIMRNSITAALPESEDPAVGRSR